MTRALAVFWFLVMTMYTPSSYPGETISQTFLVSLPDNTQCLCGFHLNTGRSTMLITSKPDHIFYCITGITPETVKKVFVLIPQDALSLEASEVYSMGNDVCSAVAMHAESSSE